MNAIIQFAIKLLAGVSSEQWNAVLQFVLAAADKFVTNEEKKKWVSDALAKLGISGSTANFLIEAALKFLRRTKQIEA